MPAPRFANTVAALSALATAAQSHDTAAAAADAAAADLQTKLTSAIDAAQAEGLNVKPTGNGA